MRVLIGEEAADPVFRLLHNLAAYFFHQLTAMLLADLLEFLLLIGVEQGRDLAVEIVGDLLQLLNTGHAGTLCTIHASSARQGLARFTSCVLQSDIDLPYRAIKTNIGDSLNVVIHIERRPGRRFISEVLELNGYDPDIDLFNYSIVYLNEGEKS